MIVGMIKYMRRSPLSHYIHTSPPITQPACKNRALWKSKSSLCCCSASSDIIQAREDRYEGLIIDSDLLPTDPAKFYTQLSASLQEWGRLKKRGIWLRLNLSQSALLPIAVQAGFDFKHAESGHMILTKWLPLEVPNLLPEGATHQVGVGAFLLNDKKEVLLVQEGTGSHRGQDIWKLPTGLANLGEDIPEAAAREVREETGIMAEFDSVLAVRQSHGYNFGRSDLFFVVGMRLLKAEQEIKLQKHELAAADWHSLEAAEQFPLFQSGEMFRSIFAVCKAYAAGQYRGMRGQKLENGFNPKSDLLVHGYEPGQ